MGYASIGQFIISFMHWHRYFKSTEIVAAESRFQRMYSTLLGITRFVSWTMHSKAFSLCLEIDIERCVRDSIDVFSSTPRSCMYREHASDLASYQINNDLVSIVSHSSLFSINSAIISGYGSFSLSRLEV